MSNFDEKTVDRIKKLEREVERLRVKESGKFIALTTPLTSTNFAGATLTNANNAIVDLSTEFSVPAAVKAVLMTVQGASGTANQYLRFGPSATYNYALQLRAQVKNISNSVTGIVPCDANGDVYLYVGTGHTMVQVYIWIWGYWL